MDDDLADRLRRLECAAAIQQLCTDYTLAVDAQDIALYESLFAEGATFTIEGLPPLDGTIIGRSEIVARRRRAIETEDQAAGFTGHVTSNFRLCELDAVGGVAWALEYFVWAWGERLLSGTYTFEVERRDGAWSIASLTVTGGARITVSTVEAAATPIADVLRSRARTFRW